LRAFRNERDVSDYDTEHKRLVGYIAELDRLVDKLEIEAQSLEAALGAEAEHLAKLAPTRASSGSRAWVDNPEFLALTASRAKLRDDLLASERGEGSADEKRARRVRFEEQIKEIDGRISAVEQQIAKADAAVAQAAALPGATEEPREERNGPPGEILAVPIVFTIFVLAPIAVAYARRIWRRGSAAVAPIPTDLTDRLDAMGQAVESIAIEVERIGEGQRFLTRVMQKNGQSLSMLKS
jgi:exonuclease VII small subunit